MELGCSHSFVPFQPVCVRCDLVNSGQRTRTDISSTDFFGGIVQLDSGAGAVVVVVLTLTRIIKSVVTGQAPVTLELRNPQGKTHPKVVHAYITADAIHASTRNI